MRKRISKMGNGIFNAFYGNNQVKDQDLSINEQLANEGHIHTNESFPYSPNGLNFLYSHKEV